MANVQAPTRGMGEWFDSNRAKILAILALIAVIVLVAALSFSWFVNSKSLSTVGKIQTPAELKVLGPNQIGTEPIEVAYDESRGDKKDGEGNVTIMRAFCVQSNNEKDNPDGGGQPFELQVANTTNISGLQINVYRVTVNGESDTSGDVVGLDGLNRTYSWSKAGNPIGFTFINSSDNTNALAKELKENDPTFGSYKDVQKNARPLYRYHSFSKSDLDGYNSSADKANDATNFIIECKWNVKNNVKETDMVYLIARGVQSN